MKNKVVVITGASSGIGKACAFTFAREGAKVILASRDVEKLKNAVDEIMPYNKNVMSVITDVSIENDCKKLIDTTIPIYILKMKYHV